MKHLANLRSAILFFAAVVGVLVVYTFVGVPFEPQAFAQQGPVPNPAGLAAAPSDLQELSERLPDQSHAMEDAAYHFANLWFAADKQNWPLASYYQRKTQAYLELAVQIKPVRKTEAGSEVDLKSILDALDHSVLAQCDKAIQDKDLAHFKTAYGQAIEGCNACHSACERSYLRVQIPDAPSVSVIDFNLKPPHQRASP